MKRFSLTLKGPRFSAEYLRRLERLGFRLTLIFEK